MSDEVSLTNSLFSIDEEMELGYTIESTLPDNTSIYMFDGFIFCYDSPDCLFHIWIVHLIEELTDRWPANMVYIVAHEHSGYECRPVSC